MSLLQYIQSYLAFYRADTTVYSRHNYPTRLETRTKEFNWIASRRDWYTHIYYIYLYIFYYDAAKATRCQLLPLRVIVQHKLIMLIYSLLQGVYASHSVFIQTERNDQAIE